MELQTYTCLIWEPNWASIILTDARRLTDAEKVGFSAEYKDKMFSTTGTLYTKLEHVSTDELPKRESDGCFPGTTNIAWILTDEEKGYYLGLEKGLSQAEAANKAADEKRIQREQDSYNYRKEHDLQDVGWTTEARTITDEGGKTTEYLHHITIHGHTIDLVERNVFDFGVAINPLHGSGLARSCMAWDKFRDGITVMDPDEAKAVQLVMRYGRYASSPIRM